jgi:hypothetical protein
MVLAGVVVLLAVARVEADPINAVIGDASWIARFGTEPGPDADETLRIRTHLAFVVERLRARDPVEPAVARRRHVALAALEGYIARGVFPRRGEDPYPGRRPRFIDDAGVYCAVGFLIAESGEPELARAIDARHEYAFVRDIHEPALVAWAAEHGFTLDELAMIQPQYAGAPDARDMRHELERSTDWIALECAHDHAMLPELALHVTSNGNGSVTVATTNREPFAACFVKLANKLDPGDGQAYDRSPEVYDFDLVVRPQPPQRQFEGALATIAIPASCTPRPGELAREVAIQADTAKGGLTIQVSTTPDNPDVNACVELDLRDGMRRFASTPNLHAKRHAALPVQVTPRRLDEALISIGPAAMRECGARRPVAVTVAAQAGDTELTITFPKRPGSVAECLAKRLQDKLQDALAVPRARRPDGTFERYFRVDGDVKTSTSLPPSPYR